MPKLKPIMTERKELRYEQLKAAALRYNLDPMELTLIQAVLITGKTERTIYGRMESGDLKKADTYTVMELVEARL